MGLNVLLHGDGGQSFFDFPNQAVQANLMGVVALAPNQQRFWGGGSGLNRVDGAEHSAAVNAMIQEVLPTIVSFDPNSVFFTGVSGGALTLSGFFVPQFMTNYKTGVELNCGALEPQVNFVDAANTLSATKIHFQSTQNELAELQTSIPQAITAYENLATQAGLNANQINTQMTVDNSPNGGHCEFDGRDFVTGVQLMSSNYAAVMQGGNGFVPGIGTVTNVSVILILSLSFQVCVEEDVGLSDVNNSANPSNRVLSVMKTYNSLLVVDKELLSIQMYSHFHRHFRRATDLELKHDHGDRLGVEDKEISIMFAAVLCHTIGIS